MPQMMPLPWIMIFFVSLFLLWVIMAVIFFLYQPYPISSSSTLFYYTIYLNWKW
nr:ATP synthase F0 subunit 8 [Artemia sinica]